MAKLATLVDHYFAAWQETSRSPLRRRERELADLRRTVKPKLGFDTELNEYCVIW